jgi:hypothetical protein
MQFFLTEIVARIVAAYFGFDTYRRIRAGLSERQIAYYDDDWLDFVDWSKWKIQRDRTPIRYWLTIAIYVNLLVACVIVTIFGFFKA